MCVYVQMYLHNNIHARIRDKNCTRFRVHSRQIGIFFRNKNFLKKKNRDLRPNINYLQPRFIVGYPRNRI